jgi:hypothetical protein
VVPAQFPAKLAIKPFVRPLLGFAFTDSYNYFEIQDNTEVML